MRLQILTGAAILAILNLFMKKVSCPYCEENIEKPAADHFMACPMCGYKSARVGSETNGYLVIDSRLPDLMDRFRQLQRNKLDAAILIDRRIGQIPIAGAERRR